jgi:hypothetical protein
VKETRLSFLVKNSPFYNQVCQSDYYAVKNSWSYELCYNNVYRLFILWIRYCYVRTAPIAIQWVMI